MRLKPGVWWEEGSPGDCQQVFNASLGNLIPDEPRGIAGSGEEEADCISRCLLPWELPGTLVLITIFPPSAAKAVDGYVKPQIKQVVPE